MKPTTARTFRRLSDPARRRRHAPVALATTLATTLALAACGGGGSATADHTLGGSVTGLTAGGLVLANGGTTQSVAAGATTFAFDAQIAAAYAVTVQTQPDGQTCSVRNGSGSASANVTSVAVVCGPYKAYVADLLGSSIAAFTVGSDGTLRAATPPVYATAHLPSGIAVDATAQFAWVGYLDDDTLAGYSIGSTGALTALTGGARAATFGRALVVHPNGKALYAVNYGGASVSQFAIDASGALTTMSTASVATGLAPSAMTVTPNGKFAYVANASGDSLSQFASDANGALSPLATASVSTSSVGTKPQGLAVNASGTYLYVAFGNTAKVCAYAIDSTTGALGNPACQATGTTPTGVAVSPNGSYLYVANSGSGNLSAFAVSGGTLTPMPVRTVATGAGPTAVATSPDGRYLYVTNATDATVSQYAIGAGGALTPLATATVASGGASPQAIVVR